MKKIKKILAVLLAAFVLTGAFATGAFAYDADELTENTICIGNAVISADNETYWLSSQGELVSAGANESNYNVKYIPANDGADAKVIFRNMNVTETVISGLAIGMYAYCSVDIELIGENTVNVSLSEDSSGAFGIISLGTDIAGDGSLDITVSNSENTNDVYGIAGEGVPVTISGGAEVSVDVYGADAVFGIGCSSLTVSDNAVLDVKAECSDCGDVAPWRCYAIGTTYGDFKVTDDAKVNAKTVTSASEELKSIPVYVENGNVELSESAKLTAVDGGKGKESYGIRINGNLTMSDDSSANLKSGDAAAVSAASYTGILNIGGNAVLTAESANCSAGSSAAVYSEKISVSENAVIKGTSGTATYAYGVACENEMSLSGKAVVEGYGSDDDSSRVYGVYANDTLSLSDESKIIAKADGCENGVSAGLTASWIDAKDNTVIQAESGIAIETMGIYAARLEADGNADISATAKDSTSVDEESHYTAGIYCEENAIVSGNAKINAVSGRGYNSFGVITEGEFSASGNSVINSSSDDGYKSAGISSEGNITLSGNAQINTSAGKGDYYSVGILLDSTPCTMTVSDNVKINASSKESELSYGVAANFRISGGTVEATGMTNAFYAPDIFDMSMYDTPYVAVNTEATAENAVEWDGTTALGAENGIYKYVFIADEKPVDPENPEEPVEPEKSFFEQIIEDIINFFEQIAEFFAFIISIFG